MRPQRTYGTRQRTKKARHTEAVLFLTRAKSLDGITAEWFATRFGYALATAETMLAAALKARVG